MKRTKIINTTYFHPKKVAPFDQWRPGRCELQSAGDGGNTEKVEKVDYLKHASLVCQADELAMSVFLLNDVGNLRVLGEKKFTLSFKL